MPIHTLHDNREETPQGGGDGDKPTESYAGGHESGLALQNPDDYKTRAEGPPPKGSLKLALYQNGMLVHSSQHGGPRFMSLPGPLVLKMKDEIKAGAMPQQLAKEMGMSGDVAVEFVDRTDQVYSGPGATGGEGAPAAADASSQQHLFQGEGMSLGSGAPAPAVASDAAVNAGLSTDKPVAKLVLRFPDGKRQQLEFNADQTVADVRATASAAVGGAGVVLVDQSSFPPKPLSDDAATLEAAGLLKGVITVKMA